MELDKTEGVYSNILNFESILKSIFELLSAKDQLALTCVCKKFNGIIKQMLWKHKFRIITIYKTRYLNILTRSNRLNLTNLEELKACKIALNHEKCEEFLYLNAKNIEILNIHAEHCCYDEEIERNSIQLQLFQNLKELSYYRAIVTNEDLEIMARSCKKLEKLQLLECFCEHLQSLIPGHNINIENFINMKMLKELIIHTQPLIMNCEIKIDVLHEILNKLKLKCLIMKNFTIDAAAAVAANSGNIENLAQQQENIIQSMEYLNMGNLNIENWCLFINYLQFCNNLIQLNITASDGNITINVEIIEILSKKCKNFEILSLENCNINVPDFCKLENLKDLSLISCDGLSYSNLQQILGGLKLQKFQLINTRIYDICNHIYISPTLQSITIDTIRFTEISEIFQMTLNEFENLHTLNWYNGDINDNWIIDKCPQLKYLHIPHPYLLRHMVFTMTALKELTFTSCNGLSWYILLKLIKNLSLQRLNILSSDAIVDDKHISEDAFQTETTLEYISLPLKIFKLAKNCWLDLIYLNRNLKYLIYGNAEDILNVGFMVNLLRREQFQNRFSSIKICGFTLETRCLTYNAFIKQFAYITINTNHYKDRNIDFTMEL